jgi:hypothetical protein
MTIETLPQLISQVESSGNPLAVRFEPAHNPANHFILGMMHNAQCNYNTAKVLCAMSWGEYQIMGDELIALGLKVSPMQYLADPAMQLDFFNRYMLSDHLTLTLSDVLGNPDKRHIFARLYNGPGNVSAYVLRIEQIARANGLEVTE